MTAGACATHLYRVRLAPPRCWRSTSRAWPQDVSSLSHSRAVVRRRPASRPHRARQAPGVSQTSLLRRHRLALEAVPVPCRSQWNAIAPGASRHSRHGSPLHLPRTVKGMGQSHTVYPQTRIRSAGPAASTSPIDTSRLRRTPRPAAMRSPRVPAPFNRREAS